MKTDRLEFRLVENRFGNDNRHEGEDRQVGVEGFEVLDGGLVAKRFRLAERKPQCDCLGLERISAPARTVGRGEDVNDLLATRMQSFENFFRESGLSDKSYAQRFIPTARLAKQAATLPRSAGSVAGATRTLAKHQRQRSWKNRSTMQLNLRRDRKLVNVTVTLPRGLLARLEVIWRLDGPGPRQW